MPLLSEIRELIDAARQRTAAAVNTELTLLYWQIGRRLHTEVLRGERAEYGKEIIATVSSQLAHEYGRGFGRRNLFNMLRFAEVFPDFEIVQSLIAQLGWTHFLHIIPIDDPLKRDFYAAMCRSEKDLESAILAELQRLIIEFGEFDAAFKGQMELHLRYLDRHERVEGEDTPIGLIFRGARLYRRRAQRVRRGGCGGVAAGPTRQSPRTAGRDP